MPPEVEEAVELVEQIADEQLAEEVLEVLTEEEITVEDIEQVVQDEAFDTLTDEQVGAISVALNDQEDEVKEAFEEEVDVFAGIRRSTSLPVAVSTLRIAVRSLLYNLLVSP